MARAKRYRAAVLGGSGYGGAELIRRLLLHPDVELARVASVDHVGEPLGAAHPSLEGASPLRFEDLAPAAAAEGMDVVLLGLPHRVSAQQVPDLAAAAGARSSNRSREAPSSDGCAAPSGSPTWSTEATRDSSTSGWSSRRRISSAPPYPDPPRTAAR